MGSFVRKYVSYYFQSLSPFPFCYKKKEQKALKYFLSTSGL